MERKNYKISQEVFKFPYNGNFEKNDNEMFSEKFCCCTIKIRKKIIKHSEFNLDQDQIKSMIENIVEQKLSNIQKEIQKLKLKQDVDNKSNHSFTDESIYSKSFLTQEKSTVIVDKRVTFDIWNVLILIDDNNLRGKFTIPDNVNQPTTKNTALKKDDIIFIVSIFVAVLLHFFEVYCVIEYVRAYH